MQFQPGIASSHSGRDALCFFQIVKERNCLWAERPDISALDSANALMSDFFRQSAYALRASSDGLRRRARQPAAAACAAKAGGGERDRTDDLLLAKQALSQLSYTPRRAADRRQTAEHRQTTERRRPSAVFRHLTLVGQGGFEPPTSRLSSARSNQLSY